MHLVRWRLSFSPPGVDFSAAPLSGTVPLTVTFTNATDGAATYLWDFGDEVTSTLVSPVHPYTQTGVYTVSLAADGPGGSDTLTRTNYITVSSSLAYTTTHRVISYTYDSLYRLITATYSTGEYYQYAYDPVGNRLSLTKSNGSRSYQYDTANRLVLSSHCAESKGEIEVLTIENS